MEPIAFFDAEMETALIPEKIGIEKMA